MTRACGNLWLGMLLVVVAGGCDTSPIRPPDGGVFVFDGAMIGARDASRDTPGTDGPAPEARPDAGVIGTPRRPDVPSENTATGANGLVEMEAWNLLQAETAYEEIVVVFRNTGSVALCSGIFDVTFLGASGATLGAITGTVDATPLAEFGVDSDCLAPGLTGIGWGNASRVTRLDEVRSMSFRYNGFQSPGARPFASVVRDFEEIYDPGTTGRFSAMRGTYRVISGVVRNPDVIIVPRDAAGLPLARLTDVQIGTFTTAWSFDTTWYEGAFEEYYEAPSYSDGASLVIDSPGARAANAHRERARTVRALTEARRLPPVR